MLFEPALYKKYLSEKIIETGIENTQANNSINDCEEQLSGINCEELYQSMIISNTKKIRRIPRGCPDNAHCIPTDKRLKYILTNKNMKKVEFHFLNDKDMETATINSHPITIKGFENFNAFPIVINELEEIATIKITRTSTSGKPVIYELVSKTVDSPEFFNCIKTTSQSFCF